MVRVIVVIRSEQGEVLDTFAVTDSKMTEQGVTDYIREAICDHFDTEEVPE